MHVKDLAVQHILTNKRDLISAVEKAVLENGYHPVEVVKELIAHNA